MRRRCSRLCRESLFSLQIYKKVEQQFGHQGSCDIIGHDAPAAGKPLQLANGEGLDDIEKTEKQEADDQEGPIGRNGDKDEELSSGLVDNDTSGVGFFELGGIGGGGRDSQDEEQQYDQQKLGEGQRVEQPLIEQDDSQAGNGPGRDRKKTEPEKGGDDPPDGFHRTAIPRRSYTPVEMISTFSIGRIGATAAPPRSIRTTPSTSGAWRSEEHTSE